MWHLAAGKSRILESWTKPLITAYRKADPILGWADAVFHKFVPGVKGQPHQNFPHETHFIQEEEQVALVETIKEVMRRI